MTSLTSKSGVIETPFAELTPERGLSWGAAFTLRAILCVVIQIAYTTFPSPIFVYFSIVLALFGVLRMSLRSVIGLCLFYMVMLKVLWMGVAFMSYSLDLATLRTTYIRSSVFYAGHMEIAVLMSAQMIFLLSALGRKIPHHADLRILPDARWRNVALLTVIVTSIFINRNSFVLTGGYQGNTNEYWSGLPAIFVIALAGWTLRQKRMTGSTLLLSI